jgi:DNA-binding NarL/FixJ family response regulator
MPRMPSAALDLVAEAATRFGELDLDGARALALESIEVDDLPHAHELLGGVHYLVEEYDSARQEWELAFDRFRRVGLERDAARVALRLAGMFASVLGQVAVGNGWIERARVQLDRVGPCVEWGYLELAVMACERPDVDDLLLSAQRALALAIEHGDVDLEARALADGGLALVSQGRTREGFARLDAALAVISTGRVGGPASGICFCSMLSACDRTGDLRRAEEWTAMVGGVLGRTGDRPRVLRTHCNLAYGAVLLAAGHWPEAEELMVGALGPEANPTIAHRAQTVAHLATLRVGQGRIEDAADLLAPFEDRITSCAPLSRVHLVRGELDLAAAVLQRGLRELVGDSLRLGPLLSTLVEVEIRRGDIDAARDAVDALAELAADVDLPAVHADARLAEGRLLVAFGDLEAALEAFARGASHLDDDERPLQLGLMRLEMAEAMAADDRPGAVAEARAALACFERIGATAARDRAAATLRSLGDTGRSRPRAASDIESTLSRRELEVLGLLRAGLTNAAIAERLYISPKTAEHHVGRILTKLGVRSRAEAAALAVRLEVG